MWVATPQLITDDIIRAIPLAPRFTIEEQQDSATKKKIRLVGDFERSDGNSLLKLHDASAPSTSAPCSQWLGHFPIEANRSPHARYNGFRSRVQTNWCGK